MAQTLSRMNFSKFDGLNKKYPLDEKIVRVFKLGMGFEEKRGKWVEGIKNQVWRSVIKNTRSWKWYRFHQSNILAILERLSLFQTAREQLQWV